MILGPPLRPAPQSQVQDFLRFAALRNIDTNRIMIAETGGRMAWAVLPIVSPGRTMLLLAPARFPPPPDPAGEAAAQLTDLVCRDFSQRDVHLAQVLLDPAESCAIEMHARVGFV
ncbi:MAG TPA: hypothetical protein VMD30_09470, partial [Tepidisphaeraceae bacterium]|nr:hypothetical protein [Tepidisphaeraceae bacterium]